MSNHALNRDAGGYLPEEYKFKFKVLIKHINYKSYKLKY
jgi:hypothetical protein